MENRKYLLINDIRVLGKFYVHFGSVYDHPNTECMREVLKVDKKGNRHFYFTPGYTSCSQEFFKCPLPIVYTQLNWIETCEDGEGSSLEAEMVVFSKDYKQSRTIHFNRVIPSGTSHPPLNPMNLNNAINLINFYVDSGNNIDLLNDGYLENNISINSLSPIDLLRIINNLDFEFYSNDLVRVGRDNLFWYEVIIKNLPKSMYLGKIFSTILSESTIVDGAKLKDGKIFATYDRHYSYSSSSGKNPMGLVTEKVEEIKDHLKLKVLDLFDPKIELNERLTKQIST